MLEEIKALHSEKEKLKSKLAKEAMGDVMDQVQEVKGVKVLAVRADGVDMNGLRNLGDQLKEKLGEGVIVIASVLDGKVNLMATATDGAQKAGAMPETSSRPLQVWWAEAAAAVPIWPRPAVRTPQAWTRPWQRWPKRWNPR